ncbi:aspartic-type endopeptidase, putative [Talaromyces stipitatus ATCC 10500]|uniref:Aspartic-type endopeptidase, putative n=1 Tax=Talaromyces stipitatus (strain ATCC 10500 / CBS 375.48 / QM 6759 / NRRL 1006) TaxID=441959 RepID=B8MJS5_TALSN|nr:aspartic-type endopeptidase, putative [Talaromyces stipitatus ATCC 10500]EED14742.1 aspartic-type endopeptidase, putative [Talaromyces stipitatus ATCC 10500]
MSGVTCLQQVQAALGLVKRSMYLPKYTNQVRTIDDNDATIDAVSLIHTSSLSSSSTMLFGIPSIIILYSFFSLISQIRVSLASSNCAPYPISARLGNATLENTTARGVSLSIGSPPQSFAFLPQWPLNDTFVYGLDGFCGNGWSEAACRTFRGGAYNTSNSSSYRDATNAPHLTESSPYPSMNWAADNLTLSSNTTLPNFTMGIARADWGEQGYHPQVAFGLGQNSTLLNALYEIGHIASRSWAMYWGQAGATSSAQQDGSFVFGGFDQAKTSGPNYTAKLDFSRSSCSTGMLVTITDMVLNFANGTDASLFGGVESAAMTACIVPDYPVLLTLPYSPYFSTFQTFTGTAITARSFGIYYYGMLYSNASIAYTGDLTLKFSSGLSVRIPNEQLVVPNLTIDKSTGSIIANSSAPELVLNSIQSINADDLPQLGRQFLTSAYLMLNQDANTYTLWEANPVTNEDLVAVDQSGTPVSMFCTTTSTTVESSMSQTGTANPGPNKNNSSHKKDVSGGAISGIVVGCIAGVALTAVMVLYTIGKKRREENKTNNGNNASNHPEVVYRRDESLYELHSHSFDPTAPQEIYGKPQNQPPAPAYELA